MDKKALRETHQREEGSLPQLMHMVGSESNELISRGVSQNVIPQGYNTGGMHMFAFTEQGVSMLATVLRSKNATEISIAIMRAFVAMRRFLTANAGLFQRIGALEQIRVDDYTTFSGIALERWFRQKMMESCRYKTIGGWWKSGGVNAKGDGDDFEIDIVAVTLKGDAEAYEVKRNPKKYSSKRLLEKVEMMKRHLFRGQEVRTGCLSLEDM